MFFQARLDERFLDRRGCGDEIYGDSILKASTWLAGVYGTRAVDRDDALDASDDETLDDAAAH